MFALRILLTLMVGVLAAAVGMGEAEAHVINSDYGGISEEDRTTHNNFPHPDEQLIIAQNNPDLVNILGLFTDYGSYDWAIRERGSDEYLTDEEANGTFTFNVGVVQFGSNPTAEGNPVNLDFLNSGTQYTIDVATQGGSLPDDILLSKNFTAGTREIDYPDIIRIDEIRNDRVTVTIQGGPSQVSFYAQIKEGDSFTDIRVDDIDFTSYGQRNVTMTGLIAGTDYQIFVQSTGFDIDDDGHAQLNFTTTGNRPPPLSLDTIFQQQVNEGNTLMFRLPLTNPFTPTEDLNFTITDVTNLGGGTTNNTDAIINGSGFFIWSTGEEHGAEGRERIFRFDITISDGTNSIDGQVFVAVRELNQAPTIERFEDQFAIQGVPFTIDVNATDPDLPPQPLRYTVVGETFGARADENTGVISWTPNAFHASRSPAPLTIRVDDRFDSGNDPKEDRFTFRVTIHDPVTIDTLSPQTVDAGQTVNYTIPVNNSDGVPERWDIVSGQTGDATIDDDGRFIWNTDGGDGRDAPYEFDIRLMAGASTVNATLSVTVNFVNQPPVFDAISTTQFATLDEPFTLDVTAIDANLGQTLSYEIISHNATGTPPTIDSATGKISWTPDTPEIVSLTVRVSDDNTPVATADITIIITSASNIPPVASDFALQVEAGNSTVFDPIIRGNVSDPDDGDTLELSISSAPTQGTAVVSGTTINYTARDNATGTDSLSYTVTDRAGTSATATVTILIGGAPVLDPIQDHEFDELTLGTLDVSAQAVIGPGEDLTWSLQDEPAGMNITSTGPTTAQIRWTPTEAQGNDTPITIEVTVSDGTFEDSQNVTVTAVEVNQNPVFETDAEQVAVVNVPFTLNVTATDEDLPEQTISYEILSNDATGTEPEINQDNGTISWTPDTIETVSITVRASDDLNGTANITIVVTVLSELPTNTAPVADDFSITVTPSGRIDVNLTDAGHISDAEQPAGTLEVTLDTRISAQGVAAIQGDIFAYFANNDATGTDTLSYTVTDAGGLTDSGTITVVITDQPLLNNTAPVATDFEVNATAGQPTQIDLTQDDRISDAEQAAETLRVLAFPPEKGTASVNGTTITYTADAAAIGQDRFGYAVSDNGALTDSGTITVTIQPPQNNTMPMNTDFEVTAIAGQPIQIDLTQDDRISDPEQAADTLRILAFPPDMGAVTVNGTTITYIPNPGASGQDMFTYTVFDSAGLSDVATITITIDTSRSDSDDDSWRKNPTFGRSFNTNEMIVSCGYSMDGVCRDVTDYHVDYERQTIQTGSTHDFTLKAYGEQTISMFQIGFGVPSVGSPINTAEALIEVTVSPNYDPDSSGYDVTDIVYRNPNNVIDEDAQITVRDAACEPGSDLACVQLDIRGVTFREQMYHEPFVIFVMDSDLRSSTFYMNDGLLVQGESLNPAPTATKPTKSGNQADVVTIQLTRTDKLNNIWTDQIGNKWTQNEYGTWLMIYTVPKEISTACSDDSNRYCDAFKERLQTHNDILEDIRDGRYGNIYTTPAYDDLAEAITILDMDGDSRTRFLEQTGMMWVRQG